MCLSVCLLICLCACHYFVCLPLCLPRCPECHKVWQDILGRRWVGVKCLLKCVSLYRVGGMAISLDHCLRRRRHSCRRCYSVLAFAINFHDTSYWWWRLMICPATIIARLLRHLCVLSFLWNILKARFAWSTYLGSSDLCENNGFVSLSYYIWPDGVFLLSVSLPCRWRLFGFPDEYI